MKRGVFFVFNWVFEVYGKFFLVVLDGHWWETGVCWMFVDGFSKVCLGFGGVQKLVFLLGFFSGFSLGFLFYRFFCGLF